MTTTLRTFERMLPCMLTHEELVQAVRELSAVLETTQHEEGAQKAQKKSMASRLAELDNARQELGRKITLGRENRRVEVRVVADYETGMATEFRTDTYEVVGARPLSVEEKQLSLMPAETVEGDRTRPFACQACGHLLENHEAGSCAVGGGECTCTGYVQQGQEAAPETTGEPVPPQEEALEPVETPDAEPGPAQEVQEPVEKTSGRRKRNGG